MRKQHLARGVTAAACLFALAAGTSAQAGKTYYIDEGTDFTNGNPCDIADVNTITASLQTSLNADAWTGLRYVNGSAWPQDFWESCSSVYGSGGLDGSYGDTKTLAVYAGHGSPHVIYFSSYHNNACTVNLSTNARLGSMSGSTAAFGMWLACDVIQPSELGSNMQQWLRQQASYVNTISIGDDEPRDFYNATNTLSNADAWLNQMGTGGRDAIMATFDNYSADSCWYVHNNAKLRANIYNFNRTGGPACGAGQPGYYWCAEWYEW
jgi:hypothetical protein